MLKEFEPKKSPNGLAGAYISEDNWYCDYDVRSTIELFEAAINNPNTVSILLSGDSGSGKTHTMEAVLEAKKLKRKHLSGNFVPTTSEGWFALMGELMRDQVNVLIIDRIEDMPMPAQAAMFHAFSYPRRAQPFPRF